MIKIMIVEDEPPITRVLAKLVGQHSGFEVVAIEYDGQAALNRLAQEEVDVVFTDIRMPVMDGLELLEQVDKRYPHILTVLLTGYQDFEYARKAINHHAFDYMLKPLSAGKIGEALGRLEMAYRHRTRESRRKVVQQLLAGEKVQAGTGLACMAAVVCAGAPSLTESGLFSPGQAFWSGNDLESLLARLSDGEDSFLVFNGAFKAEKVIVTQFLTPVQAQGLFRKLFEELTAEGAVPVTLVGHSAPVEMDNVYRTVRKLHELLAQRVTLYTSRMVWEDLSGFVPQEAEPNTGLVNRIVDAVCAQDKAQLEKVLLELLGGPGGQGALQQEFMRTLDRVITDERLIVGQKAWRSEVNREDLGEAVEGAVDHDSLCANLISLLLTSKSDARRPMKNMVAEIERYLIEHYNEPISHDMLAQRFGYVPSYISKIFRKVNNASPSEFLTRYRIRKAKEIMDSRSDVLVRNVAELVGYSNPYYFSKIFHKETGLWPRDYLAARHGAGVPVEGPE